MRGNRLDDNTADRLLAGDVAPEDAPAGYDSFAALVGASRQPATPAELAAEASVIAMVAEAVQSPVSVPTTTPRKKMLTRVLTAKAAAIAAVTFIGAGAAAAATNTLPDPAQRAVAEAASHVGLDVPKPHKSGEDKPGKGPDASGGAHKGLCTAASHGNDENEHSGRSESVAARNLAKAAADANKTVDEFCADVTTTTAHVEGAQSENESDDNGGPPTTAGKSADHAVVTTPNAGAGNPDTPDAPGTNDDQGRATADEHSGGRSDPNGGGG